MRIQEVWKSWIPDESQCFPGFGLYDSVLEDFTEQRVNASNPIVCKAWKCWKRSIAPFVAMSFILLASLLLVVRPGAPRSVWGYAEGIKVC